MNDFTMSEDDCILILLNFMILSSAVQTRVAMLKNIILCLTQTRKWGHLTRRDYIRRFYWLIGGPHLHSWSNCRPDIWMNVLTMQLLFQPVGWIWHVWFVRPVGPTSRTNVHTTQLLLQLLDQPVGPTGWADRLVQQLDRVNTAFRPSLPKLRMSSCAGATHV